MAKKQARQQAVEPVPTVQAEITLIPLNHLAVAPLNARTASDDVRDLATAILEAGRLLQNLVVYPGTDGYQVAAGGRRLGAMHLLMTMGHIPEDWPVPCQIVSEAEALVMSLTENHQRKAMHPVDEAVAFAKLVQAKKKHSAIAALFGVTKRYVAQRVKLAAVHPTILDAARAGEIDLETLEAFTITADPYKQLDAWIDLGKNAQPWTVRKALTVEMFNADDRLVKFIGLDAYRDAGGTFAEDLFSDDDPALLCDGALVRKLAEKKLAKEVKKIKAEGWKWIEVNLDAVHPVAGGRNVKAMGSILLPASPELQAEIDALEAELARLQDQDEITGDDDRRWGEIEQRLEEIEESREGYTEEQKAFAGCYVLIDWKGEPRVFRGFVTADSFAELEAWEESQKPTAEPAPAADDNREEEQGADQGEAPPVTREVMTFTAITIRNMYEDLVEVRSMIDDGHTGGANRDYLLDKMQAVLDLLAGRLLEV